MKLFSSVQFKQRTLTNMYKYSKMSCAEQCLQIQPDSRVKYRYNAHIMHFGYKA